MVAHRVERGQRGETQDEPGSGKQPQRSLPVRRNEVREWRFHYASTFANIDARVSKSPSISLDVLHPIPLGIGARWGYTCGSATLPGGPHPVYLPLPPCATRAHRACASARDSGHGCCGPAPPRPLRPSPRKGLRSRYGSLRPLQLGCCHRREREPARDLGAGGLWARRSPERIRPRHSVRVCGRRPDDRHRGRLRRSPRRVGPRRLPVTVRTARLHDGERLL